MTPAQLLHEEHTYILMVVRAAKTTAQQLEKHKSISPSLLFDIVHFMREFADKCHHGKEEDILFPAMEKAGVPTEGCPLAALRRDHITGRKLVSDLEQAAKELKSHQHNADQHVIEALNNLYQLYPSHIWKEDQMVFPMESRLFSSQQMKVLVEQFEQVEQTIGPDTHEKWKQLAVKLANDWEIP